MTSGERGGKRKKKRKKDRKIKLVELNYTFW
jgi:hypothetical protein